MLEKDPTNGKALCNQGRAFILVNDLEKAKACLTEAAAAHPEDLLIKKELARIPGLEKKQLEKEKSTWKNAFKKI